MEINGGIDIFIRTQLGRILGLHLHLVPGRPVDDIGDFLSPEFGKGSAQVQVDPVLVDKRETPVKVQLVFVRGAAAHHRKQAAVRVMLGPDIALCQCGILHVVHGFHRNQVRQVIPQAGKYAPFHHGDQVSVAALLGFSGRGTLGFEIPDFVSFFLEHLNKLLDVRIVQIGIFILNGFLGCLELIALGILRAVPALIFGPQEAGEIRILQVSEFLILGILIDCPVVQALLVPDVIHLEYGAPWNQVIDQEHNGRDYDQQRKQGEQNPPQHVSSHEYTHLPKK